MKMRTGFTLIEILLVVILLGILAAIVTPMLASASDDARASALRENLRTIRAQCELFNFEHNGLSPGYPAGGGAPDAATFVAQMLNPTDMDGAVGKRNEAGMDFGPYLLKIPVNAVNGKDTIKMIGDGEDMPAAPSGEFGWLYKASTRALRSDAMGADTGGEPFYDY